MIAMIMTIMMMMMRRRRRLMDEVGSHYNFCCGSVYPTIIDKNTKSG
jgi:hypothetical protein